MVRFVTAALAFALTALALPSPSPLTPDPAGDKNVGNGAGQQFIGGACLSGADCASTCCATLDGAGICSGLGAQFQAGKTGCGFVSGSGAAAPAASTTAAAAETAQATSGTAAVSGIDPDAAGSQNVGKADGSQFITGQCLSDADCASACCSVANGQCASPAVATCGFVAAAAA
ncbi:hypothetical protein F4809DRAFT_637446 [Biscogniauxia mediterranea]|nr:hypothetical protein F4809DRAFT_637446 [Biscogniauxia mediterranea]